MTTLTAPPEAPTQPRRVAASPMRTALAVVFIAIAGLSTVSAIVAWWAEDAIYDQDIMVAAFGDLPNDPVQAEKLGTWIATETVETLAVQERLNAALPLGLSLFSGRLSDGIEQATAAASSRLIQTEWFAGMWEDALPLAHSTMIDALEGTEGSVLVAEDQVVSVDISAAILATYDQLMDVLPDLGENALLSGLTGLEPGELEATLDRLVLGNLPADLGTFVLIESDAVGAVRELKSGLGTITVLSVFTALFAAAAAVVIALRPGRALLIVGMVLAASVLVGWLATIGAERAVINALADLPFDSGGFDPTLLLTGWHVVLIGFLAMSVAVGSFSWISRWRRAGISPSAVS